MVVLSSVDEPDGLVAQRRHALLDRERRAARACGASVTISSFISSVTAQHLVDADPVEVAGVRRRSCSPRPCTKSSCRGRRRRARRTRAPRASARTARRSAGRCGARAAGRRRRAATTRSGTARCPCRGSGAARDVASVACSDDSTKWPVSAACTAMRAVSTSRISPTRIASGSWRRIDRSPLANVTPACSLIWIWLIVGNTYSTGSSIVMTLISSLLIAVSVA